MKSFTVTFHHTTNYGATLQAYSLQRYLKTIGVDNEIMEYTDTDRLYLKLDTTSLRGFIITCISNMFTFIHKKDILELKSDFKNFHENYMNISPHEYINYEEIKKNPPNANILITGSDQVWNLKTSPQHLETRFLNFGEKDAIRFSYAASVGELNYSNEEKTKVKKLLKNFNGVSLREETASTYYNIFSDKKCVSVLDPVFLTSKEKWTEISEDIEIDCKYILCYFVQGNNRISEVINTLKNNTGYKVVSINYTSMPHCKADYQLYNVSPQQFLKLYCNAEVVVTTSFHGTAFGLIFEKPTYALIRNYNETRISDLYTKMGLTEYLIDFDRKIEMPEEFDFNYKDIMNEHINKSKEYIKEMVKLGNKNK